jgi:serine/threonine protein kinase
VNSVSFSPDGRFALSGGSDKTLQLWDIETGKCLSTFKGHTDSVNSVSFSPDGRFALSGGGFRDEALLLWDIKTGECLRIFEEHTFEVSTVSISPSGRYALSGGNFRDKTLRLWDISASPSTSLRARPNAGVEMGECLRTFDGHTKIVHSVCFSPDERFALSGSEDKTLRLWDIETGQCLRTFDGQTDSVNSVSFSPDGRYAASGGDQTLRLWFLDWDLEEKETADWDESARPYLQTFLYLHVPYAQNLPKGREPTQKEIVPSLTRRGKPHWTEEDFEQLLFTLGCAGYGWLRPEGVRKELIKMTREWQETNHNASPASQKMDPEKCQYCFRCGRQVNPYSFWVDTSYTCSKCGNIRIAEERDKTAVSDCSKCKRILLPSFVYCPYCGTSTTTNPVGNDSPELSPAQTPIQYGDVLNDRYRVDADSAISDSNPNMRKGYDLIRKQPVILKFTYPIREIQMPGTISIQGQQEIDLLKRLKHPCIIKVLDRQEHAGNPYLVLEYLEGGSLASLFYQKRVSFLDAIKLLHPVALALLYLHHKEIIHNDIKPANILLSKKGGPKLADFGIAKDQPGYREQDSPVAGTMPYMAPERQTGQATPQTDIYALGVTLYELITGDQAADFRPDHQALNPSGIITDLPEDIVSLTRKMTMSSAEDRIPDVASVIQEMEKIYLRHAAAVDHSKLTFEYCGYCGKPRIADLYNSHSWCKYCYQDPWEDVNDDFPTKWSCDCGGGHLIGCSYCALCGKPSPYFQRKFPSAYRGEEISSLEGVRKLAMAWEQFNQSAGNQYEIIKNLTVNVFQAHDQDGNDVVVKIGAGYGLDSGLYTYDHLLEEIQIMQEISHPNIVKFVRSHDGPVLVTHFVTGDTLFNRFAHERASVKETVDILCQLADAVSYVHTCNIIHRDLTPHNVIWDGKKVTLIDFGYAARFQSSKPPGSIVATLFLGEDNTTLLMRSWFRPPEIQEGSHYPATDVFYLGFLGLFLMDVNLYVDVEAVLPRSTTDDDLLYWKIKGQYLSADQQIDEAFARLRQHPGIPPVLLEILNIAVAPEIADRYQNATEFLNVLKSLQTSAVEAPTICKTCEKSFSSEFNFCPYCGAEQVTGKAGTL